MQAYVLIQAEAGRAASVGAELAKIAGVIPADVVTGPYDVIARVEADTINSLGKLVVARRSAGLPAGRPSALPTREPGDRRES